MVGDPADRDPVIGPIANGRQVSRVQSMIEKGQEEGAKLVCGGTGKPEGLETGFYARPTVFSEVNNQMLIAREEIFGPVLVMIPYDTVDNAVAIANDSEYGLSGYVFGDDAQARQVAVRLRPGNVHINGAGPDVQAAVGGDNTRGMGGERGRGGVAWGGVRHGRGDRKKRVVGGNVGRARDGEGRRMEAVDEVPGRAELRGAGALGQVAGNGREVGLEPVDRLDERVQQFRPIAPEMQV